MIVNPVCHWASSGEPPLLVYAPGLPDADVIGNQWGAGAQLPQEQVFYDDSASMVAAGLPAPTHILTFQEAVQGSDIDEKVGGSSYDLTDNSAGPSSPHYGLPARGLYMNGKLDGSERNAIEFLKDVDNHQLRAKDTSVYNLGLQSWAMFFIFRTKWLGTATGASEYMGKTNPSINAPGWRIQGDYRSLTFFAEDQANHLVSCGTSNVAYSGGAWHYGFCWIDFTNDTMCLKTDLDDSAPVSIASFTGSVDSTGYYSIGYVPGPQYQESWSFQIAYQCFWTGANAESMISNYAPNLRKMFAPTLNYSNCPIDPDPNRSGVYQDSIGTIIGEDPAIGTLAASWAGAFGASPTQGNQKLLKYDSRISRSNKLCIATSAQCTNHAPTSELDSGWTQVSATIESAYQVGWNTNAGTAPDGYRNTTSRVRTNGGGGHIRSSNIAVTAGTWWHASMFVQRAYPEVTDVPGVTIRLYDVTNAAWLSGTTVTATDKWQQVKVDQVIPGTCTSIRIYIYPGTYSVTRYVNVWGVTLAGNKTYSAAPLGPIYKKALYRSYTYPHTTRYTGAAGSFCKGAQGEIEAVFYPNLSFVPRSSFICVFRSSLATGYLVNQRRIVINTSTVGAPYTLMRIAGGFYDSAGAVITGSSMRTGDISPDAEYTVVLRWNNAGLPSGNTIEMIVNGGAPIGSNTAFTGTDTVENLIIGARDDIQTSSNVGDASIVSVRCWENPR